MRIYLFINEYLNEPKNYKAHTNYSAGYVSAYGHERYIVTDFQEGAREMFSIGQPVYDRGGNLMGYLGMTLWDRLDYSHHKNGLRIPVERWEICLPTKHCKSGKKIYTYWQNELRKEDKTE